MQRIRWMAGLATACVLVVGGASPGRAASMGTTITTSASPSVPLGMPVTDTATLANVVRPTGTVTFTLFDASDPGCSGGGTFTATVDLVGIGSATSPPFIPTVASTYRWRVVYSGDQFNAAATSACGSANESVTVTPTTPSNPTLSTVAATASPSPAVGAQVRDTAALANGFGPTGTISFTLFANAGCAGTPVFSSTVAVAGNGSYVSGPFTTVAAGTYYWVAAYGGDANNNQVVSPCGAANESVTVSAGGTGASPSSQTGAPKVLSSSSARFTAIVNPRGLPTTAHFEYAVALPGASPAAGVYDSRTPDQPVGADLSDHPVSATVAGLLPNSTYHVRAVATNASGATPGADATFRTAKDPPPPPPVLGRSVDATPISGIVYVLLPGTGHVARARARASAAKGVGFIPLTEARQLPVGTVFDTTGGLARLTSATDKRARVQAGDFGGGLFRILQNRRERGLTELRLVLTSSAGKTCAAAGKKAQASAKRALPKSVLTLLRASVKGRYRTRGRFSSATVRGTIWTTTDRCDGTLTAVRRGVVVVSDFRRRRQVVVRAGRSYLAKAP